MRQIPKNTCASISKHNSSCNCIWNSALLSACFVSDSFPFLQHKRYSGQRIVSFHKYFCSDNPEMLLKNSRPIWKSVFEVFLVSIANFVSFFIHGGLRWLKRDHFYYCLNYSWFERNIPQECTWQWQFSFKICYGTYTLWTVTTHVFCCILSSPLSSLGVVFYLQSSDTCMLKWSLAVCSAAVQDC